MIPFFSAFALHDVCPSTKIDGMFKKDRKVSYLRFRMGSLMRKITKIGLWIWAEFEICWPSTGLFGGTLATKTRIELLLWRKLHFCMQNKIYPTKSLGKNVNMTSSKKTILQTIGPLRKMLNLPTFWHPDGWGQRDGSSHLLVGDLFFMDIHGYSNSQ